MSKRKSWPVDGSLEEDEASVAAFVRK
eukprot:g38157.t1